MRGRSSIRASATESDAEGEGEEEDDEDADEEDDGDEERDGLEDATGDFAGFRSGAGVFGGLGVEAFARDCVGGGAGATSRARGPACRLLGVAIAEGGEAAGAGGDAAEAACEGVGRMATVPLVVDPLEDATATAGAATRVGGDVEADDVPCEREAPEASEASEAAAALGSDPRWGSDSGARADWEAAGAAATATVVGARSWAVGLGRGSVPGAGGWDRSRPAAADASGGESLGAGARPAIAAARTDSSSLGEASQ